MAVELKAKIILDTSQFSAQIRALQETLQSVDSRFETLNKTLSPTAQKIDIVSNATTKLDSAASKTSTAIDKIAASTAAANKQLTMLKLQGASLALTTIGGAMASSDNSVTSGAGRLLSAAGNGANAGSFLGPKGAIAGAVGSVAAEGWRLYAESLKKAENEAAAMLKTTLALQVAASATNRAIRTMNDSGSLKSTIADLKEKMEVAKDNYAAGFADERITTEHLESYNGLLENAEARLKSVQAEELRLAQIQKESADKQKAQAFEDAKSQYSAAYLRAEEERTLTKSISSSPTAAKTITSLKNYIENLKQEKSTEETLMNKDNFSQSLAKISQLDNAINRWGDQLERLNEVKDVQAKAETAQKTKVNAPLTDAMRRIGANLTPSTLGVDKDKQKIDLAKRSAKTLREVRDLLAKQNNLKLEAKFG